MKFSNSQKIGLYSIYQVTMSPELSHKERDNVLSFCNNERWHLTWYIEHHPENICCENNPKMQGWLLKEQARRMEFPRISCGNHLWLDPLTKLWMFPLNHYRRLPNIWCLILQDLINSNSSWFPWEWLAIHVRSSVITGKVNTCNNSNIGKAW